MQGPEHNRKPTQEDNGRGRRVFFDETFIVASTTMDFEALKQSLCQRLGFYTIKLDKTMEEEYFHIPKGGGKPSLQQRVVAFGRAAAYVHHGTGYMIACALALADRRGDGIARELKKGGSVDELRQRICRLAWNEACCDKDVLNNGGTFLQKIDLDVRRGVSSGFLKMPFE